MHHRRIRMVSCPFHRDRTPSMAIDREERFFCFECKRSGVVRDLPPPKHDEGCNAGAADFRG